MGSGLRKPPGWSAEIASVVGLIATDGNLGRKKPAISIVSKDIDLLETVRRCLGLAAPIKPRLAPLQSPTVVTYTDRYQVAKSERYVDERLYVSIASASRSFVEWLRATVSRLVGVAGSITVRRRPGKNPVWMPCPDRKRIKAERFLFPSLCAGAVVRTPEGGLDL